MESGGDRHSEDDGRSSAGARGGAHGGGGRDRAPSRSEQGRGRRGRSAEGAGSGGSTGNPGHRGAYDSEDPLAVWRPGGPASFPASFDGPVRRRNPGPAAAGAPSERGSGRINRDVDLDELDPSGQARKRAAARGPRGKKRPRSRARRILKWTALGLVLIIGAAGGFAYYVYDTTIGDLKHTSLLPQGVKASALPTNAYGDSPLNIFLIGSDTRDTAEDCDLGGDCGSGQSNAGANGDGELILHISADRTNATVLSIPRDTWMTNAPVCSTDSSGNVTVTGHIAAKVNSALQWGPQCQVYADELLTGITPTGYIMFDFSGVVKMSDAVGGVPVCVTRSVDDYSPDPTVGGSLLRLPAGQSTIEGVQALQFMRTRHSFFDGSDVGRTETVHYFLSQLIGVARTKFNLGSAGTLLDLAQAAAQSTTVSANLDSISGLEGLAEAMSQIPSSKISFITEPWQYSSNPQDSNVYLIQPAAQQMFANVQNDVPYSTVTTPANPTPAASTAATPTPSMNRAAASGQSSAPPAPASAASAPSESFLMNAGESGSECVPVRQYYTDQGINGNMSDGTLDIGSTSQIVAGLNGDSPDSGTP